MVQPPAHARACTLHKSHPTSVAFFDEAGAISSDRFFVVGLLRVEDHAALLKQVKAIRKKHKFYDEFKWGSITTSSLAASESLIELLLDSSANFSCFVADRHVADPVARFGNTFRAYEKLATQLLIGSVQPYELVTVIADNYSAPNNRSFESTVKIECNNRLDRLAVTSVIQVDSKATEGLQLVDMLVGAVAFGFKADCGLGNHRSLKGQLAQKLRAKLGVPNFDSGYKSSAFGVRLYEHDKWLRRQQMRLGSPS
ncbi:hypothetical protein CFP71_29935 [Amycolatopsis thailandensis]|uniref:DUF3800 domain-containing protein n=1 Tax=Amycolatopsis thailandensis TaxID=589330 RepID=A0A229RSB7_9PSEU|nr:DUF3800 domain-containing protein [Amycolatopsis thailandensis]OXM49567.1 hypothetical protein CFP71_29935 [Amycolatopsis thailandensis]